MEFDLTCISFGVKAKGVKLSGTINLERSIFDGVSGVLWAVEFFSLIIFDFLCNKPVELKTVKTGLGKNLPGVLCGCSWDIVYKEGRQYPGQITIFNLITTFNFILLYRQIASRQLFYVTTLPRLNRDILDVSPIDYLGIEVPKD